MRRTTLPINQLLAWARLNGVCFKHVAPKTGIIIGKVEKGSGIVATTDLPDGEPKTLISVPADIILTKEEVRRQVGLDGNMKAVFDAAEDLGKTSRGAIMVFLLLQITQSCPDYAGEPLTKSSFTDYVKLLPESVLLPTFYTEEEKELLFGTTLQDPLEQKLRSLESEFDNFREATAEVSWAQKHWWDDKTGRLTLVDWLLVDALYRSRSLELPGIGHAMVPCIDLANHGSQFGKNATYQLDGDGSVLLQTMGPAVKEGIEICISYGDDKSACEMLFSYGCLEFSMYNPITVFLDLEIPEDDPLRMVKQSVNQEPPGFRIVVEDDDLNWEGDYVWWACVNEEDGLNFRVAQTVDGVRQVEMIWHGEQVEPSNFRSLLEKDPRWEIFQLRAVVMLEERVQLQMNHLEGSDSTFAQSRGQEGVRDEVWKSISAFRSLEAGFMDHFYWVLQEQKEKHSESDTVRKYLVAQQKSQSPARDISKGTEDDPDFS